MKKLKTPWLTICLIFLVHQFVVLSSSFFGQSLLAGRKRHLDPVEVIIKGMTRWDGGWFLRIAQEGYNLKSAAFFPLYPFLIKTLQGVGLSSQAAALLISNTSFLLMLIVFYHLVTLDYPESVAVRSLWYLAMFPTAFYFSVMYTESLYLFLVMLTLYLGRTRRWMLASLCGMLASLSRSLGFFC
jgi:Gpi18-like mannosyltransferase